MTSVRQSFVFALEDTFKGGKGANMSWIAPPPGSYFSNTNTRQTTAVYTTGSKRWETTAFGSFSGTWDWTFMMDYKYLEPFMLAFDKVNGEQFTSSLTTDSPFYTPKDKVFKFTKERTGRVPTFCVRRKINHVIAGGPMDEQVELKGCIVQSISFSRSASSSQYQVSMSGVYANEEMKTGDLKYTTDYQEYDGQLVEYSCVLLADNSNADIGSAKYVANTDSTSISINNNVSMVYNTCTPFATQYYEDRNQFQISTSCYSTNPEAYKTRVYSGGYDKTARMPMSKNLKPLAKMFVASFDSLIADDANADSAIKGAMNNATHYVLFEVTDAVLKSMKWVNGDGSKLTDSLSSVDCRNISMTVKTDEKQLILHTVNSTDITPIESEIKTYEFQVTEDLSVFVPTNYVAHRLLRIELKKDKNVSTEKMGTEEDAKTYAQYFENLTKGYRFLPATNTPVGGGTTLDALIISPNLSNVAGLVISSTTGKDENGKDYPYLKMTGTPTAVGDGYYFICNDKRVFGVLEIEVVEDSTA